MLVFGRCWIPMVTVDINLCAALKEVQNIIIHFLYCAFVQKKLYMNISVHLRDIATSSATYLHRFRDAAVHLLDIHPYIHTYDHIHIHTCTIIYIHVHIPKHTYLDKPIYIVRYLYTPIHTYTYIYMPI